jgi:hypothetical protein
MAHKLGGLLDNLVNAILDVGGGGSEDVITQCRYS